MRLVIIFFALIMVVTYVSGSIDNARCSIEGIEDVKGVCLDNRHCEIWENLKKNLTITEIKKFKRCDSEDEEMLCCLNKKDVEKVLNIFSNSIRSENVITVRSVENIEETSSKDIKGNDETCLTKEKGIEGICVSLESCDYLFYKSQINPNSYDLIEARVEKCQRIVGKPYCCGIIENVNFRRNSLSTDPPKMTTEFSSSQYDNDTPCGRSGTCKLYKDCPYLKNRIKGIENNDDERNFLNENFCHYFQSKPYYCCDIQENERTTTKASYINISTTRNDLILDGTTTLRIVANEPEFDSCGENALCKPLQECDYLKYVKEDMQFQGKLDFFDNRRCSTSSGNIHLCCSIDERKQMNTKVLPNVIPQYEIIQAIPYSFCKDPNGANGFCAADCPSLNQTLRSIKSKSAQNDNFRERFCGYSRLAKPHYCCVPSPNRQIKISKNAEIVSPDHCTINDLKGYCIGLKHSGYLLNYYTESKLNQDSNRRKMRIFLAKIKCEPSVRHQIYANYVCSLHSKTDQNHYIQIIDEILNSDASCQTDERTGICRSLENCDYANRSYNKLSNEKARNDLLEYKKCSPREWQSQSTNDHYVCCISSESENDLIKKFKYPRTDEKNFCRYDNETEGICLSLDKCAYLEDQYKKNKLQGNFMNDVGCNPIDPLTGENFVCCNQVENENFLYVPVTGLTNCGNDGQADIGSGEDTNFYEFPWTVQIFHQIFKELNIVCGGTLINEEAVLTSNSCVGNYSANDLTVRLGDWDISKEKDCDDSYYADPLYNDCADAFKDAKAKMILKHKESDIALVQLNEKVTNTKHIIPICLDKYNLQSFSNNELVSVGWGIKKNFETMSTIKRKSIIKIEEIGNHTFTAGGKKAMDTCQNDIGGGLVRFDQNKKLWFLVGVYSNGAENCENDRKPAVYVDVAKHYKWIEKSYQKMQGRFSQWRQILSKWC